MSVLEKLRLYRFELRHLIILFGIIVAFQVLLSVIHQASLRTFLVGAQEWYQNDSVEKLATVTSTSLELLVETANPRDQMSDSQVKRIIQSVDIIFSQQLLGRNARDVCILVPKGDRVYVIEDGKALVAALSARWSDLPQPAGRRERTIEMFRSIRSRLRAREEVTSILEGRQTFHTFVPFVPNGEFVGALYVKNEPDFRFITSSIISNYNETSIIYTSLIVLGLVAMFVASSYTMSERNKAQKLLFEEHEKLLRETINHEKEFAFTKRIYHTHHKAEKVMAFIKQDLLALSPANIEEIKYRIMKYANFIARVIYDMKWYEPALHTIRNPMFETNVNEVIRFIVRNLFERVAKASSHLSFTLDLDDRLPPVPINEFVVWEMLEPLIQNCLDHAHRDHINVTIRTCLEGASGSPSIVIEDNGEGIRSDLLERNTQGVRRLFQEGLTTKQESGRHSGYGCSIAYDLATNRCGWNLDAMNAPQGGCRFVLTLPGTTQRQASL